LPAIETHIFGLVAQSIDMRAGMFGHIDEARGARSRLLRALLVAAVERIDQPWRVAGKDGRAKITRLLKVIHVGCSCEIHAVLLKYARYRLLSTMCLYS
jgi:hypothetical protein